MYPNSVELMREMSAAGIEHRSDTPLEDDNMIDTIRVGWAGHHLPATTILFRVNDRGAHLEVERLGEVAPDKRLQALELLNDLNGTYRWVKFSMDEDDVLTCWTRCTRAWRRSWASLRLARRRSRRIVSGP